MNDFSQNGIVANLHDFSFKTTKHIEDELLNFSKYNKMELSPELIDLVIRFIFNIAVAYVIVIQIYHHPMKPLFQDLVLRLRLGKQ